MSGIVSILIVIGCIIAYWWILGLIITTSRLIKTPLWASVITPVNRRSFGDLTIVLDTVRPLLEQHGFRYAYSRSQRAPQAMDCMTSDMRDIYYHPEHDVHAEVLLATKLEPGIFCRIYLWNTFVDGTALLTINGHRDEVTPLPSIVRVEDAGCNDFGEQLRHHLEVRRQYPVQRSHPENVLRAAQELALQTLPKVQEEQQLYYQSSQRNGEPIFGFRFIPALRYANNLLNALGEKRKPTAALPMPTDMTQEGFAEVTRIFERNFFSRSLCMLHGMQTPMWFRHSTFAISAVAFLGFGTWVWGWPLTIMIGIIIAVHEGGHWLAMKLAKFRNVQVFFLPGLGGATSGEKHEASPLTQVAVYLAGPVPGVLLALAMLLWTVMHPEVNASDWGLWLRRYASLSLVINGANLLPILPFDGGRIVGILLVQRLPWLRVIFAALSCAALFALAYRLHDKLLFGLALMTLMSLRQQIRIAQAQSTMRRQKLTGDPIINDYARTIFPFCEFLTQAPFRSWNFNIRMSLAKALLPSYLARQANWMQIVAGLGAYLVCTFSPIIFVGAILLAAPTESREKIWETAIFMYDHSFGILQSKLAGRTGRSGQ